MMYGIIAVALIFILANLPQYIRKQLTEKIADESSKAKENLQTSQLNFLTKIEWLRFFPLKKILLGVIWLFCLFYAVRGVFMTINDPRGIFIFLTVLFWLITIFTARKIWRYIKLSYHCVPVLNHIKTKEELKESLQGECFEKVLFEHNILRKYFPVLISENWVVMNGRLFPRHGVEKIYYLHESPVWNYEQIRFIWKRSRTHEAVDSGKLSGTNGDTAKTFYIGSKSSSIYFCLYEKEKEQKSKGIKTDIKNRFEIRLKNGKAEQTIEQLVFSRNPEQTIANLILTQIDFPDYILWDIFLDNVTTSLPFIMTPVAVNMDKTKRWLERQVMPSLLMIKEIEKKTGAKYLEEIDRHTRLTEKQELKIKQMTTDIADMIEKDTAVPQRNDGIF